MSFKLQAGRRLFAFLTCMALTMPIANATETTAEATTIPTPDPAVLDNLIRAEPVIPYANSLKLDATEQQVLDALQNDDFEQAAALLSKRSNQDPETLYLLAYIDRQTENYRSAIKRLQKFSEERSPQSGNTRQNMLVLMEIGDCYYYLNEVDKAIAHYNSALLLSKGVDPLDTATAEVLERLSNLLCKQGNFEQALPFAQQLATSSRTSAQSGDPIAIGRLFWANLTLSQIYTQLKKQDELNVLQDFQTELFSRVLAARAKLTANITVADQLAQFEVLKQHLLNRFLLQNNPRTLADYLWCTSEFKMRSLPLISWQPEKQPKAVILCIHGLGLENRAFESFARQMIERDFTVFALDARGFGAWQSEIGSETVNFDDTLQDIRAVIRLIKRKTPGLPVFLLGESMGGAIALRAASEYGRELTGIISSVPSAERYGERKMAVSVAAHFLRNPNKAFNIGEQVTKQATSKPLVRKLWKADPKARTSLSAKELINFDNFMHDTEDHCSEIKSTPVLVVQGLADKLVKPKGTYEMFDNVASKDKVMLIIGNAEHLIFETPKQSPVLMDGLTAWLNNHLQPGAPQPVEETASEGN